MNIHTLFNKIKKSDFSKFEFRESEWNSIKEYLKSHAKECYLKESEVVRFQGMTLDERKEYLRTHILPSEGNKKSGDFGEIFSYIFIHHEYEGNRINLYGPKKWKWKQDKNSPAPYSDVVFFHMKDQNKPHSKDFILSLESKMAATQPSRDENRIQQAIDGAEKDRVNRLAKTISWLETKYERDNLQEELPIIRRFKDPTNQPYNRLYYAIAIFDILYTENEISKGYSKPVDEIRLYILSINDLQKLYEEYFAEVIDET
ncbi:Hachiman antiphage defense system protein HamA [Leptospira sp. SA-E8]|uniref:Hachiman antiphage defense system protein HamA n=1 Tax=Leptospira sp. SA-E8 TaxID=3422259 RepID=UPI003EB88331